MDERNRPGGIHSGYGPMERRFYHFQQVPWFRLFFGWGRGGPESALGHEAREQFLTRILSKLSETQRLVFVLCEIDGHSSEEVALLMGVPVRAVSQRIQRVRARLAAKLEQRSDRERSVGL
jgi:RNA polymerase sigma factor (sigma-70 family)